MKTIKSNMIKVVVLLGITFLMFGVQAFAQTYTTIANGNWTAPATWQGGSVPPTGSDIPTTATINIRHDVAYNTGNPIKNRGVIRIEPNATTTTMARLLVPTNINVENYTTGDFYILNASFVQYRFVPGNNGQPYSGNNPNAAKQSGTFKNLGGFIEVRNSFIEVAQDWTSEGGGQRLVINSCLYTGQNFAVLGTGTSDLLVNSTFSIGWHGSGNWNFADGSIEYSGVRIQLAGSSGSLKHDSGTATGQIDYIALYNHVVPFSGGGEISVSSSVTGTVSLAAYWSNTFINNGNRFTGTLAKDGPGAPNSTTRITQYFVNGACKPDGNPPIGIITGHLYIDTNGDGNQDVGEPNIAGVDVLITDIYGGTQTLTTDASGNWSAYVSPGATISNIAESDPQYPTGYTRTEGTDPTTTTVVANTSTLSDNDGFYLPATLTGHLYIDTNGDGNQDVGEPNLANGNVLITNANGGTQTVTTNASGDWTASVPPGSTSANIDETDPDYPAGYTQTEGTDPTTTVAVAGASTNGGVDGFFLPATISGFVRIDNDGNATGDVPQSGVLVALFTAADVLVSSQSTLADGSYSFGNVAPGTYKIVQAVPNSYTAVNDADGGDFTVIGNNVALVLNAGDALIDQSFVNSQPASIAGNVFNDTNRLTDSIVNGAGTNAGGIYINLVNPNDNTVLASLPVNADGTYLFAPVHGVSNNSPHLLILSPQVVTVGTVLTTSSLPIPWFSTGENIGVAAGDDGTVNGILSVTTTVGPVEQANFGIVQAPDITPVITAQPNVMNGPTDFNIRVQVNELFQRETEGTIVVRVPKDNRWTLREAYDGDLVELDGVALENNKWTYSENDTQHIFTTVNPNVVIPAGGFSRFGIKARWVAEAQEGIYTISVQIDSFSGKEIPINNNSDAEKIDFFDQ